MGCVDNVFKNVLANAVSASSAMPFLKYVVFLKRLLGRLKEDVLSPLYFLISEGGELAIRLLETKK